MTPEQIELVRITLVAEIWLLSAAGEMWVLDNLSANAKALKPASEEVTRRAALEKHSEEFRAGLKTIHELKAQLALL